MTQTDFGYTGQRAVESLGLMDYKARFYDPRLGRFAQADTIVPNAADPQSWNRYSYVQNNPLRYKDPTGHYQCEDADECDISDWIGNPSNTGHHDDAPDAPNANPSGHDWSREEGNGPVQGFTSQAIAGQSLDSADRYTIFYPGPGYVGPLPDQIKSALVAQGVDAAMLDSVTIHIIQGPCSSGAPACAWFNDIYLPDSQYFDPLAPNSYLVHELVHVRQFRDLPWLAPIWARTGLQRGLARRNEPGFDIYKEYWVERQGLACEEAFYGNPNMPVDADPCNLGRDSRSEEAAKNA